jgi:phosphoglucomutase/phosphomannomutase
VLRETIDLAISKGADIVLASDPDADRIAAACADSQSGKWVPLSGNQLAALLADYAVRKFKGADTGTSGRNPFVVKTLVTTELISRIAEQNGVRAIRDLPVGFKWIAQAMDEYGANDFLFGAEESLGYLVGDYARDKDASVAALLACELAAELKSEGRSVLDHLDDLYRQHGLHIETAVSKSRPGRSGAAEITRIMQAFRLTPPKSMAGMPVNRVHDFVDGTIRDLSGKSSPLAGLRQQQVMLEFDKPGWRLVARPSGTEPKIKFYLFGVEPAAELKTRTALDSKKQEAAATMNRLVADLESFADAAACE